MIQAALAGFRLARGFENELFLCVHGFISWRTAHHRDAVMARRSASMDARAWRLDT